MLHTAWNLPSYHTGVLLLSVLLLKSSLRIRQQTVPGKSALANCFLLVKSEARFHSFLWGHAITMVWKNGEIKSVRQWSETIRRMAQKRVESTSAPGLKSILRLPGRLKCELCIMPCTTPQPGLSPVQEWQPEQWAVLCDSDTAYTQPSPHLTHTVQGLSQNN